MRSSASKEKTRRCLDHFFFGVCFFSETGSASLLRRLRRIQQKIKANIKRAAITIGTAMAACRPELHETPLHWSFSDTVGASPVVLEAASAAVPVGDSESVVVAGVSLEDIIEVDKVVCVSIELLLEKAVVDEDSTEEVVLEAAVPVVSVNSLCREALKLSKAEPLGLFVPVMPLKAPGGLKSPIGMTLQNWKPMW